MVINIKRGTINAFISKTYGKCNGHRSLYEKGVRLVEVTKTLLQ